MQSPIRLECNLIAVNRVNIASDGGAAPPHHDHHRGRHHTYLFIGSTIIEADHRILLIRLCFSYVCSSSSQCSAASRVSSSWNFPNDPAALSINHTSAITSTHTQVGGVSN